MACTVTSIAKIPALCLTLHLHFPHIYSTISLSRRWRLISPCFRLVSSLCKTAALEGRVLWRGRGGVLARWISRTSRSIAAWRLRSWLRNWCASMISSPAAIILPPANPTRRCFTSSVREGDCITLNRSWTALATLLTFCPPGPGARMNSSWISSSLSWIDGVITIMR